MRHTFSLTVSFIVYLTLGMGVGVLHNLSKLLVHSLHQRQDATTNTERLQYNNKNYEELPHPPCATDTMN